MFGGDLADLQGDRVGALGDETGASMPRSYRSATE